MTVKEALEMTNENALVDICTATFRVLGYPKTLLNPEDDGGLSEATLNRSIIGVRKESDHKVSIDC